MTFIIILLDSTVLSACLLEAINKQISVAFDLFSSILILDGAFCFNFKAGYLEMNKETVAFKIISGG